MKIGIQISPRTVRRYMPKNPKGPKVPTQRWMTFVRNHAQAIIAAFFIVATATFRLVYVLVVMEIATRHILRVNVTRHPTALWTLQQFRERVHGDEGYRFIIHDRDSIFPRELDASLGTLGLKILCVLEAVDYVFLCIGLFRAAPSEVTMFKRIGVLVMSALMMFPASYFAWGSEGHRIVAKIAAKNLSPDTHKKLATKPE